MTTARPQWPDDGPVVPPRKSGPLLLAALVFVALMVACIAFTS